MFGFMDKKGDYKYDLIFSLILGLLIIGLSFYFIFNELFSSEDIDMEVCRQSIQARAVLPDVEEGGITVASFKDSYPLKCRTRVFEIDKNDIVKNRAAGIIAERMAECWALFDSGDSNSFPAEVFKTSSCVPCVRIGLSEDAKKYLKENEDVEINIRDALDERMTKDFSYYTYLENSGKKFSAFSFGNAVPFNLLGSEFRIESIDGFSGIVPMFWENVELRNRMGGTFVAKMGSVNISLPEVFDYRNGDLLISYGIVSIEEGVFGDYVPYLFYFQTGQERDSFNEVRKKFISNPAREIWKVIEDFFTARLLVLEGDNLDKVEDASVSFCEQWEGIPA